MKILLLFFSIISMISGSVFAQINETAFQIHLDTSFNASNFESLDEIIQDKRLVFTGENHTFTHSNQLTKLKLMMYLYDQGFRYFLIELGYGIGYLANKYITTGDEEAMNILSFGDEEKNPMIGFLETLKRFNEGKTEVEKIKVYGVDYTRYPLYSIRAMLHILDANDAEKSHPVFYEDLTVLSSAREDIDQLGFNPRGRKLDEDFDLRNSFKTYRSRLFELSIRNIITDFYGDSSKLKHSLKDDFIEFHNILNEMENTLNWYKGEGISVQTHLQRERHLEERILQLLAQDSTAKIGGQFGRCHIRNKGYEQDCFSFDQLSMVERLEEREELNGKILSIPIFYEEIWDYKVRRSKLPLETSSLYLYNTEDKQVSFKSDDLSGFVLLNSFPRNAQLDEILSKNSDDLLGRLHNKYRENYTESHLDFFVQDASFTTDINADFNLAIFPENHRYFGIAFRSVSEKSWNSIFRISGIAPNRFELDTINIRYSNWRYDLGIGYNFIHTKQFSLYSDIYALLGFSKIQEQRIPLLSNSTYPTFQEKQTYRNLYLGGMASIGARLKLGFFSIFFEAAYQHDISSRQWKSRGLEIPSSAPVDFSAVSFLGGISFFTADLINRKD